MLKGDFNEWACFSAQQAAEKAAKSLLQALGAEAWGHSVWGLLKKLPKGFKPSNMLLQAARRLDKAYIPARYPNAHPEGSPSQLYSRMEAETFIADAERIITYCKGNLSKAYKKRS